MERRNEMFEENFFDMDIHFQLEYMQSLIDWRPIKPLRSLNLIALDGN